jgi:DNA-binding CsgD family transcriptional regulator
MLVDDIFFAAIEDVKKIENLKEGRLILEQLKDKYNLENLVYHSQRSPGPENNSPFLILTYPQSWIEHYIENNYFAIDPVVRQGFSSALPLDWEQFERTELPYCKKIFGEAAEANLGKRGMSFPIQSPGGGTALVSITSNAGKTEWKQDKEMIARDFQLLAHYLHQKFNSLLGIGNEKNIHLSPREIECLQWSAEGKTISDIAIILNLSDRTVRLYLDTARHKLNCLNKTHAVAKAIALGMICYTERKSTFNPSFLTD